MIRKTITIMLCLCFLLEVSGFAQVAGPPGLPVISSNLPVTDAFRPEHLRSIAYDPLKSNFLTILDKGSVREKDCGKLDDSTRQLFKYFLIGLSLPNESFWVNLRPDSPDNIIDENLVRTDIGRIFLEADVQLKKDTAKYTAVDTPEGRVYWERLYRKAEEIFGRENVSIPTLTRPWIVPDEIILRRSANGVYVYKATLKVMLESDHLKDLSEYSFNDPRLKALNDYSTQLIRESILPRLTKDVNTAKRYASLRQVYFSLVLAQWFKTQVSDNPGFELLRSKINGKDLSGLTSKPGWNKDSYFKQYQSSFKKGEYNKLERVQTIYGTSLRQYFSGGIKVFQPASSEIILRATSGIKIFPSNTREELIRINKDDPFVIEEVAGASQSGGLPIVKGSTNLPPGAPALNSKDGGSTEVPRVFSNKDGGSAEAPRILSDKDGGSAEAPRIPSDKDGGEMITVQNLDQVSLALEEAPANSLLYLDIDDTVLFHDGVYASYKFAMARLQMKKKIMFPEEFQREEKEILAQITRESIRMEKLGMEAGILKVVPGVEKLMLAAIRKNIRVFLVTNRPAELLEVTEEMLKSLGIRGYEKIYCAGYGNGKAGLVLNDILKLGPEQVFFVDNNEENVRLFASQLGDVPLQAFHLDRQEEKKEFVQAYYLRELKRILSGNLASRRDKALAELLFYSAVMNLAELDGQVRKDRLKDLRMLIEEFLPSRRWFFEITKAGKYLEEFSVILSESREKDMQSFVLERTNNVVPVNVDLALDSPREAAVKMLRAARNKSAVVMKMDKMRDTYGRSIYAFRRFGAITQEINGLLPGNSSRQTGYCLRELFKNAFYHGNKLNFDLPVYFYLTLGDDNEIESAEVYDNGARKFESYLQRSVLLEKRLVGKGVGVQDIAMLGWGYERMKFSNFPGSMVRIKINEINTGSFSGDGGREKIETSTVQDFLKNNHAAITVEDFGADGAVVDAKKAWKIFLENDAGGSRKLLREFLYQMTGVKSHDLPGARENMARRILRQLNGKDMEDQETGLLLFISGQGDILGMLDMKLSAPDNGSVEGLWVASELRRTGNGIGTKLLDTFFRILKESKVREALIEHLFEAEDFYKKYLEKRGIARVNYSYDADYLEYDGFSFLVTWQGIEKIVNAIESGKSETASQDGGREIPGGIDLRQLSINSGAKVQIPDKVKQDAPVDAALTRQWQEISNIVSKGFLPNASRLKECFSLAVSRKALPADPQEILSCLADILRIEEVLCLQTAPELKELLALLESE